MSDTAPKRSWLRFAFSLRTLFVVVTVWACWLGYHLNWIRERHEVKNRPDGMSGAQGQNGWVAEPPWALGLLGEPGYFWILLYFPDPERLRIVGSGPSNWENGESLLTSEERIEFSRVQRLFPEANVDVTYLPRQDSR